MVNSPVASTVEASPEVPRFQVHRLGQGEGRDASSDPSPTEVFNPSDGNGVGVEDENSLQPWIRSAAEPGRAGPVAADNLAWPGR
jgi:hypothetical protein